MGKANQKRSRENKQRAINRKRNEQLSPTGDQTGSSKSEENYQDAHKSKVRTEKSGFDKFIEFLEQWGLILGVIVVLSGFIFWASSLNFDVNKAKDDISKNEKGIEKIKNKIESSSIKTVSIEKDIEYIKQANKRIDSELGSLDRSVSELKYTKKPAALEIKSANK